MVRTSRWGPDAVAVALLGATFGVVVLLLGQAAMTLRAHDRMVEATLEDFASFASQNIAAELNSAFSSVFLDEIVRSRAAHYAWTSGQIVQVPDARRSLPAGAFPLHFSINSGEVVSHDGPIDPETASWIAEEVVRHATDVFPAPAPYALLRSTGPRGQRALAYRKEEGYDGVSLYGFLIDFSAFAPLYSQSVDAAPTLPRSLAAEVEPDEVLSVQVLFPQDGRVLFSRERTGTGEAVEVTTIAAKAGRIAVRVELDAERARGLAIGASPPVGIGSFTGLAILTLGLLGIAVALLRRATRLSQMRERFVENVSHDLRTPLAQIRMFAETLLLGRLTNAEERTRSLQIISQQAIQLSDLVENVLHAAGRASRPAHPTRTDLQRLLDDTADALAPTAREARARIVHEVDGAPEAIVDSGALRRILMNLVDNALKYGPPEQTVKVTLRNDEDRLTVIVDDQGPGVPRRDRLRIWERFSRLEHGGHDATGTGIGLAVVRDLAERHGGGVRVEDSPRGGARMIVILATERPVRGEPMTTERNAVEAGSSPTEALP